MPFEKKPAYVPKGGKWWATLGDLEYVTNHGERVFIDSGFNTDLNTLPPPVRVFYSVGGSPTYASTVHDYLYRVQKIEGQWIPRWKADRIYLEIMIEENTRPLKAFLFWMGVRFGGWLWGWNVQKKKIGNPTKWRPFG